MRRFEDIIDSTISKLITIKNKGNCSTYIRENGIKKIKLPSRTRWMFHYEVLSRAIEIKNHLPTLCSKANISLISENDLQICQDVVKILEQYKIQQLRMEKVDQTISSVIPTVLNLSGYLNKFITNFETINQFTKKLCDDINQRFGDVLDVTDKRFNISYAMATYLDPSVKMILNCSNYKPIKNLVTNKLKLLVITVAEGSDAVHNDEYKHLNMHTDDDQPTEIQL